MRVIRYTLPFLAIVMLTLGCGKNESTSPNGSSGTTGALKLLLTDAPASFDHVNVTFSEVAVNNGNGWTVLAGEARTIDLLALSNGLTTVLGEGEFAPGQYGQIRLKLSKAEVVADGVTYNLDVPSGYTSGLKLNGGFAIEPGITTELVVDFDAARSIHATGKKGDYKLRPVLRLIAKSVTGAISGRVIDPDATPWVYAIAGADTVATAYVNADTGYFMLGYLPAGSYDISFASELGQQYFRSAVSVTVGATTSLGDIAGNIIVTE